MPGRNTIIRLSENSTVTIPYERSFRRIQRPEDMNLSSEDFSRYQFCGCGWPHHMLVPKGNETGITFDYFVMISNFVDDTVHQEVDKYVSIKIDYFSFKLTLFTGYSVVMMRSHSVVYVTDYFLIVVQWDFHLIVRYHRLIHLIILLRLIKI